MKTVRIVWYHRDSFFLPPLSRGVAQRCWGASLQQLRLLFCTAFNRNATVYSKRTAFNGWRTNPSCIHVPFV